jgi:hypothetical protein
MLTVPSDVASPAGSLTSSDFSDATCSASGWSFTGWSALPPQPNCQAIVRPRVIIIIGCRFNRTSARRADMDTAPLNDTIALWAMPSEKLIEAHGRVS